MRKNWKNFIAAARLRLIIRFCLPQRLVVLDQVQSVGSQVIEVEGIVSRRFVQNAYRISIKMGLHEVSLFYGGGI